MLASLPAGKAGIALKNEDILGKIGRLLRDFFRQAVQLLQVNQLVSFFINHALRSGLCVGEVRRLGRFGLRFRQVGLGQQRQRGSPTGAAQVVVAGIILPVGQPFHRSVQVANDQAENIGGFGGGNLKVIVCRWEPIAQRHLTEENIQLKVGKRPQEARFADDSIF